MTEEKIIMYDSPEAAQQKQLTLWVASDGRAFNDESTARYAGCTHKKCECGEITSKNYICCEKCRKKLDNGRYLAMPFKEWDEETPLCIYNDDQYFFDIDDIIYYCEERKIKLPELQLVICKPTLAHEIDGNEYFCDDLPEDGDLPDELLLAFDELNEKIRRCKKPLCWTPGKERTSIETEVED